MAHQLFSLIRKLEEQRLWFRIDRHRADSLMITVTAVGERLEIDVFEDGHVEYSRFRSDESVENDTAQLLSIIRHHGSESDSTGSIAVPQTTTAVVVYKITHAAPWRAAEAVGVFAGAPVDLADGFIHFSTAAQVAETAARHFAGQADLLLVAVEAAALGPALRWEPSRGGALFPHLYGPLPMAAVRAVVALPLGPDGSHRLPAGLA